MAAARIDGRAAPSELDGAMGGGAFRADVEQLLVREPTPGAVGASLLYLPASSPAFDPIAMASSKFKAPPRAAAAPTIPDLCEAIRVALEARTPTECQNDFAAAGYNATYRKML
jgi:hypothetical protein